MSAGPAEAASHGQFESLRVEQRSDGVAVLLVDTPRRLNLLHPGFVDELQQALDGLDAAEAAGVVIASAKPDHFVAGADLHRLRDVHFSSEGAELSQSAQSVHDRIVASAHPVVAAIHGPCLGVGLDLAVACHARVATSSPVTELGYPEVHLGLLPGAGGTQRLPRLLSLQNALRLLLQGESVGAEEALRIGLVDQVVSGEELIPAAVQAVLRMAPGHRTTEGTKDGGRWRPSPGGVRRDFARDNPVARRLILAQARRRLQQETRGNMPAPERILAVVSEGLSRGMHQGLLAESRAFGELVTSPQAARLIDLFFARRELERETQRGATGGEAPHKLRVAVVGASRSGIALSLATVGRAALPVRLQDDDPEALGAALRAIQTLADEGVAAGRLSAADRSMLKTRVSPTTAFSGIADADVVIEASSQAPEERRRIRALIESCVRADAVIATTTSAVAVARYAEGSRHPERVVGMRWFPAAGGRALVEVAGSGAAAPWAVDACVSLAMQQGTTVMVVGDGIGGYVARTMSPYLVEAAYLLVQGVTGDRLDDALMGWGFTVGPTPLLHNLGRDGEAAAKGVMLGAFEASSAAGAGDPAGPRGARGPDPRREAGGRGNHRSRMPRLGRGLGLGRRRPKKGLASAEIVHRCVLRLLNEAVRCLADGVLRCPRDGDVGAVDGQGFPAFRGGPFRYADEVGAEEIVRRLRGFEGQFGSRFIPAPLLVEMAETGRTFYGDGGPGPAR